MQHLGQQLFKRIKLIFPSLSDVQQFHQLRTGRSQWDPGLLIFCLEKFG